MYAADIPKADGDSMINFHKLLNQNQLSASRNTYHIDNCCIIHHTWPDCKPICQIVSQMFTHGSKDMHT